MGILTIRKYPDPILRVKCEDVTFFDSELADFANDMIDTMRALKGVGLSAPQVGKSVRVIVVEAEEGKPVVLVNPSILSANGSKAYEEGCLSFPGQFSKVTSAEKIEVEYQDVKGTKVVRNFEGLESTAIQHEIDHLNGKLFIDRMSPKQRAAIKTNMMRRR